jgi:hypothetical protein
MPTLSHLERLLNLEGYEAIFIPGNFSSADRVLNLEITAYLTIGVTSPLCRKLFAVKSMPVPTKSMEDILRVVLPSGSEPAISQPSKWPSQLAQSILDLAARLTEEKASLSEATYSNLSQPDSQVLQLALCNLRFIIELELVVTDAGKEVDADRVRQGVYYFHNSFQDLLVVLDKLLINSGFTAFLAKFVAVALFFLIEHSIVKVCEQLDRLYAPGHDAQTPVSRNDNAIATICSLAGYTFRKIPREIASQEQARLSQLGMVDGTIIPFPTNDT